MQSGGNEGCMEDASKAHNVRAWLAHRPLRTLPATSMHPPCTLHSPTTVYPLCTPSIIPTHPYAPSMHPICPHYAPTVCQRCTICAAPTCFFCVLYAPCAPTIPRLQGGGGGISAGDIFGGGKFRHPQILVPWGQLPEISAHPNSGEQ